ncbi:MAG TPA: hypothetical protein VJC16_06130 [Candidatus Nanoarchaeia archaeon]|nr:hypothetical protein [Candidatus Nanoarchaeia archaeon]
MAKRRKKAIRHHKKPKARKSVPKPYPRKFLRNVPPEHSLWIINGTIVKSMRELLKELKSMNEEAFRYHVSRNGNEFARWIREVIGDITLSRQLKHARTRERCARMVAARIKQ